jgi:hypothetical protein
MLTAEWEFEGNANTMVFACVPWRSLKPGDVRLSDGRRAMVSRAW